MIAAIDIVGLTVPKGRSVVLDGLCLKVPSGSIAAVVGRSQAGKTVLLSAILGRIADVSGTIRVCDLDGREQTGEILQRTTWVPGCGVLEEHLTVRENVSLVMRLCQVPEPTRTAVERALRESDVPDRTFDLRARSLTRLEAFSVWIAIARLRRSLVILLDDPAASLGPLDAVRATILIRELRSNGPTILVVTRDQQFAEDVADAVYLLEGGRLSTTRASRPETPPGHTADLL
jgi:ABC-2 type transport system ATP-binding protein